MNVDADDTKSQAKFSAAPQSGSDNNDNSESKDDEDDEFIITGDDPVNDQQHATNKNKSPAKPKPTNHDDEEAKQWNEDVSFGPCCRLQSAMQPNYAPTNDDEMVDDFGFVVKKNDELLRERQEAFTSECRAKLELIAQLEFQRIMDGTPSGAAPSSQQLTTKNPSITGVAVTANGPPRLQHHLAKTDRLRQLILTKGISHGLRATLWMRLSMAIDKHIQSELSYKDILRQSLSAAALRRGAAMLRINIQKDIERDMPLLLPNEIVYQNLRSPASRRLRNVIDACMWLYPNIGYKQELAKIAAFLLLIVDERDTFWLVCAVIEDMLPASYYTAESLGAQADMLVLEDLLRKVMPDVYEILKRHQLSLSVWMQCWFTTLFVGALVPHQPLLLCRLLDWFFLDGSRALFGLALALIDVERPNIAASADDAVALCNIIANAASFSSSPSSLYSPEHLIELAARHASTAFDAEDPTDDEQRSGDDLLQQMRQNHMARLMVDAGLISLPAGIATNNNSSSGGGGVENSSSGISLPKQHVTRRIKQLKSKKKNDAAQQPVLFYATNGALLTSSGATAGSSADAKRDKNILQTELIIDLRQAVMSIVKHFQADASVKKINCTPDYSPESHFRDREIFIRASKSKFQRARALLDFEATDDDELGFQKNDIITIISQRDDHCWIGELHNDTSTTTRGWFPARFVELLDERDGQQYSPLGDDSVDERISHLVRNQLCEALKQILLHDIKTAGIIAGKYHPWHFIEDVAEREIQQAIDKRTNDRGVQSRLQLYRAFRLDEDDGGGGGPYSNSRVLSADELMLRAVKAINASHNAYHADDDVKLRTLICLALNEQCLHLWLETLCSAQAILQKWYLPNAFMRSPVWMQIKCELRLLAQLPFTLRHDYELCYSTSGGASGDSTKLGTYNGDENDDIRRGDAKSEVKAASARGIRDAAVKQSAELLDVSLMRAPSKRNPLKESVRDMLVRYHLFSWELHG